MGPERINLVNKNNSLNEYYQHKKPKVSQTNCHQEPSPKQKQGHEACPICWEPIKINGEKAQTHCRLKVDEDLTCPGKPSNIVGSLDKLGWQKHFD